MSLPSEAPQADIDKVLFIDRATRDYVSAAPMVGEGYLPDMYSVTSISDATNERQHFPFVVLDLDHNEGETGYTATIYERTRDFANQHKKAFVFTAVGTMSGVATAIAVLHHKKRNS